jgi:hypothetical protein
MCHPMEDDMQLKTRWKFVDEGGRIPQGERGVMIEIGYKWVRFTEIASGRRSKVRREIFDLTKERRMVVGA